MVPAGAAPIPVSAGADPIATVRGADALCIMTPWPAYRSIDPAEVAAAMRGRVVIDPYRVLDPERACASRLDWITLGVADHPKETR